MCLWNFASSINPSSGRKLRYPVPGCAKTFGDGTCTFFRGTPSMGMFLYDYTELGQPLVECGESGT